MQPGLVNYLVMNMDAFQQLQQECTRDKDVSSSIMGGLIDPNDVLWCQLIKYSRQNTCRV